MSPYCGIDVSKRRLDVALRVDGRLSKRWSVVNAPQGWQQLLQEVAAEACFVLEPTGPYHEGILDVLAGASRHVRLVNPLRVRRFVQSIGRGDKSDLLDSEALTLFAEKVDGPQYTPPSEAQKRLRDLHDRKRQIEEMIRAETNRLEKSHDPFVVQTIRDHIELLKKQKDAIEQELQCTITQEKTLARNLELLTTIPGVGTISAVTLLAELPFLERFPNAAELAAFVGLAPVQMQSGTTLNRAYTPKGGKPRLKAALWMPALVAVKHNPAIKAQYERLVQHGKPKKLAVVAAMHKLLRICYGVLKHQQPFQPLPELVT